MALASRGRRDPDTGPVPIEDPSEAAAARSAARRIHAAAGLATAAGTTAFLLLS